MPILNAICKHAGARIERLKNAIAESLLEHEGEFPLITAASLLAGGATVFMIFVFTRLFEW